MPSIPTPKVQPYDTPDEEVERFLRQLAEIAVDSFIAKQARERKEDQEKNQE